MWSYYIDDPISVAEENKDYSLKDSKSFGHKGSIVGSATAADLTKTGVETVISLKNI